MSNVEWLLVNIKNIYLQDFSHVVFSLLTNLSVQFQDFDRIDNYQFRSRLFPEMDLSFQENAKEE